MAYTEYLAASNCERKSFRFDQNLNVLGYFTGDLLLHFSDFRHQILGLQKSPKRPSSNMPRERAVIISLFRFSPCCLFLIINILHGAPGIVDADQNYASILYSSIVIILLTQLKGSDECLHFFLQDFYGFKVLPEVPGPRDFSVSKSPAPFGSLT
jgi:hypothetical protein